MRVDYSYEHLVYFNTRSNEYQTLSTHVQSKHQLQELKCNFDNFIEITHLTATFVTVKVKFISYLNIGAT